MLIYFIESENILDSSIVQYTNIKNLKEYSEVKNNFMSNMLCCRRSQQDSSVKSIHKRYKLAKNNLKSYIIGIDIEHLDSEQLLQPLVYIEHAEQSKNLFNSRSMKNQLIINKINYYCSIKNYYTCFDLFEGLLLLNTYKYKKYPNLIYGHIDQIRPFFNLFYRDIK